MKKITFALVLAMVFMATPALAHHGADLAHPNGDPQLVTNAWGLTGYETPQASFGELLFDESGYSETCTISWGCANIFSLDYYRNAQIETARQLMSYGLLNQFPRYTYWAQLVQ